jgi:hypothetical protein
VKNYISNSMKYGNTNQLLNNDCDSFTNEWKIFSTYLFFSNSSLKKSISNFEKYNILYLFQTICSQNIYTNNLLLWSIYIFKKICTQVAHLIDNYVFLFGCIYSLAIKETNPKYNCCDFLLKTFEIEYECGEKMISCVNKFIDFNELIFGITEKTKIINSIK